MAEKLTALKKAGCRVEVIYPNGPGTQDTIYPQVTAELLNCKIPTYNTRPVNGLYVHNKVILIDGVYQGVTNQKIVYTTSQNLTMTSLRESNEVMLRIPTSSAYQPYWANFEEIKSHSVRVGSSAAAKTTAGVDSASKTPVLPDNAPDPHE